jgi:hypothetical protein
VFEYTNRESDRLRVFPDHKRPGVVRLATEGRHSKEMFTLVSMGSEEAAELAQALLDAAGTGARVIGDSDTTNADTAAIRERLALVSGYGTDWSYEDDDASRTWVVSYATDNPLAGLVATVPDYGEHLADLIAHAPADLAALLDEVDRLRGVLDSITANESVVIAKADLADGMRAALRAKATPLAAEYLSCGATIDRPGGTPYACARRVAHEGGCSPRRDDAPASV